jgi:predicted SprT family Zn-dependent metalloprotease
MNLQDFKDHTIEKMSKHGLNNWKFKFDGAKNRLGQCNYTYRELSFSRHYVELNALEQMQNTVLHEIAHALTPGSGHNYVWMNKIVEIGGRPSRLCVDPKVIRPQGRYVAECKCKILHYKHRDTGSQFRCRTCKMVLEYSHNDNVLTKD